MKNYRTIILFFIICYSNLLSQGFDWQWSARFPVKNPQDYYGLNINYGLDYLVGHISMLEDRVDCPDFVGANGSHFGIGLNYTHWEKNNRYAIYGLLQYNAFSVSAYSIDKVPLTDDVIARYKISLDYNFNQIELLVGVNYRILETHFSIGAGINIGGLFNGSFSVNEEILGPADVPPFQTNPPSYSREIVAGELKSLNIFQIRPHIKLSYNLQLGRGTYIEPNLCYKIPLGSIFNGDDVLHNSILFGVSFYRAF